MKKAGSPIVNPAADSGSADLKQTDGTTLEKAQVDTRLVAPNRTQDRLFIQPLGRLIA